jgi:predicted nucleic acid-binding protein
VCIDASLALKLVLPEPDSKTARALWQKWIAEQAVRVAPPLFLSEGISVIRNRAYRKHLLADEADEAAKSFLNLPVEIVSPSGLVERAWELSKKFERPNAYDSHYLALAENLQREFWTADERLFNTLRAELVWVKFLGHFMQ